MQFSNAIFILGVIFLSIQIIEGQNERSLVEKLLKFEQTFFNFNAYKEYLSSFPPTYQEVKLDNDGKYQIKTEII